MGQFPEMEGKGGGSQPQYLGDLASRKAAGALLDEQSEHGEPCFLGESGQRKHDGFGFHVSIIIEI